MHAVWRLVFVLLVSPSRWLNIPSTAAEATALAPAPTPLPAAKFPFAVEWSYNAPCSMTGFFNEIVTVLLFLEPHVRTLSLKMGRCSDEFLDTMLPPAHGALVRRLQRRHALLDQIAALRGDDDAPAGERVENRVVIHHHHACAVEQCVIRRLVPRPPHLFCPIFRLASHRLARPRPPPPPTSFQLRAVARSQVS